MVLSIDAVCQQSTPSPSQTARPEQQRVWRGPLKLGSLGASCQNVDLATYGKITFFARHEGVAYGISTPKQTLEEHEDLRVYLWLSNESNRSLELYVCCGIPLLNEVQILDSSGRRLVSNWEKQRQSTKPPLEVCSCSHGEVAQPGSCRVIDSGVLNGASWNTFSMPPGTYTIMEDPQPPHPIPERPVYPKVSPKDERLEITIVPDSDAAPNK